MKQNIDNYIIDFAKKLEQNGLLLSYDAEHIDIEEGSSCNLKNIFIRQSSKLFDFDNSIDKHKKCKVENLYSFYEHFDHLNILVKIPIDDFSINPIVDGNRLNDIFGWSSLFNKNDKGILVVSHKKKIANFIRALEYDGNILFVSVGSDIEYLIDDNAYDKDLNIRQYEYISGILLKYRSFEYDLIDFQFSGIHYSIEDYFNFQKSIINLHHKKEKDQIQSSITQFNYQMSTLQNKLDRLNNDLKNIDSKCELKCSKIDSARIAYDLMNV